MYKIVKDPSGKISYTKVVDGIGISFVESPGNRDWQDYLDWVAEGNIPEEAEESTPNLS
jgi:hypothetical protein